MTPEDVADLVLKVFAKVAYVGVYDRARPYLIAYADREYVTGPPWEPIAYWYDLPIYCHAMGSIHGPRPNENAPAE